MQSFFIVKKEIKKEIERKTDPKKKKKSLNNLFLLSLLDFMPAQRPLIWHSESGNCFVVPAPSEAALFVLIFSMWELYHTYRPDIHWGKHRIGHCI
jgi:hypothetical protein